MFAESDSSHLELFTGYTHSSFNQNVVSTDVGFNGWNASFAYKPVPWIGGMADFGGNYGTSDGFNIHAYTFLFGPQVSVPLGRVSLFVHALFGETHLIRTDPHSGGRAASSRNSSSAALGGGIDIRLTPGIAWRSQADYLHARFHMSDPQNPYPDANYRISTGVVFRF
jgi:hypothetical protein